MKKLIRKIHQSDLFGIFIETGCGINVSNELLKVSGASKTVYLSESPYSSDIQKDKYNLQENERSVSVDFLNKIINFDDYKNLLENKKINMIFASSFQVGNNNDISTHGWICLKYKNSVIYYHLSIHESLSREEYIERITENALKLIEAKNKETPQNCDVDIVINQDLSFNYEKTIEFISNQKDKDQFTVLSKDEIERLESVVRNKEELIIFKGSFNPIQNAHLYAMEWSKEKYKTKKAYFMISLNTFQKGKFSVDEIMFRIGLIFQLGYKVIICNKPFFKENINFIRTKFSKKIILILGLDTFNRLMLDYEKEENEIKKLELLTKDFPKTNFECIYRENSELPKHLEHNTVNNINLVENNSFKALSSTQVRKMYREKNYNEIKKVIPETIYKTVLEKGKDFWK